MFGFLPEAIERGEYFLTLLGAMKGHMHESRGYFLYLLSYFIKDVLIMVFRGSLLLFSPSCF